MKPDIVGPGLLCLQMPAEFLNSDQVSISYDPTCFSPSDLLGIPNSVCCAQLNQAPSRWDVELPLDLDKLRIRILPCSSSQSPMLFCEDASGAAEGTPTPVVPPPTPVVPSAPGEAGYAGLLAAWGAAYTSTHAIRKCTGGLLIEQHTHHQTPYEGTL